MRTAVLVVVIGTFLALSFYIAVWGQKMLNYGDDLIDRIDQLLDRAEIDIELNTEQSKTIAHSLSVLEHLASGLEDLAPSTGRHSSPAVEVDPNPATAPRKMPPVPAPTPAEPVPDPIPINSTAKRKRRRTRAG